MVDPTPQTHPRPRRVWRSIGAVVLGIIAGAGLSLVTDQVLHVLGVYPPWGQPMYDAGLNLLALAYRIPYNVIGCYIIALLAPRAPMFHAMIGGAIGLVVSAVGLIAAVAIGGVGPLWYPAALVVTALPCAWVGGAIHQAWHLRL